MSIVVALAIFVCVGGTNAYAEGFIFKKNLTAGSRGSEVSALQQLLIDGGFLKINNPTGYFGPATKKALSAWQTSVGISPAAGYFGAISRAKMNAVIPQIPVITISVQDIIATTTPLVETMAVSSGGATILKGTTTVVAPNNKDGSPIRLTIPKIGVDAGFQYTGLTKEGIMEIPNNIIDIGWFIDSPRPGEKGVSIMTGHVAQIRGGVVIKPGVFYALGELVAGDKIYIVNDKGETMTFAVREVRLYDPAADATDVFAAKDGGAHLNLITCEGTWNPEKLSYSRRLVVFTDVVQ